MAGDILEIRMQTGEVQCGLCNKWTLMEQSVPTYNGDLVSNDFPDDLHSKGGGSFPVCRPCYDKHERGEVPTFDHYYIKPGAVFIDGAGI